MPQRPVPLQLYFSETSSGREVCDEHEARQILEKTLHNVQLRANANGECFGGWISDATREAGAALGADRLEFLLTCSFARANDGING
jgi:hypothetical protein